MGAAGPAQIGYDQVPAAQAHRRRVQRVVVMPHPVGSDRRRSDCRCRCSSSGTTSSTGCAHRDAGFPTTTLPNAGVWHADFDWKDRDEFFRYFSVRNSLITHALHGTIDAKTTGQLAGTRDHRGSRVDAIRHGVHDDSRYRGLPGWPRGAARRRAAALAAIRAERKEYDETVVHPAVEIGELTGAIPRIQPRGPLPRKERINLVLAKRWLFQWLGRTIPRAGCHCGRRQSVVARLAVRPSGGDGRLAVGRPDSTTRQAEAHQADQANERRRSRSSDAEAPALQEQYRSALPELISRENWARLYDS